VRRDRLAGRRERRSLGCDAGLEAVETVIRTGMLKLGGGMLKKLLAADPGYGEPRVPCGQGHEVEFVSYRDKAFATVLGPVPCRLPGRPITGRPITGRPGTWRRYSSGAGDSAGGSP
jgi:hypothetical protein